MLLATDVHYRSEFAKAVALSFDTWDADTPSAIYEKQLSEVYPYVPGQFYKRELPCILALLEELEVDNIEAIVIDGYVFLDAAGSYGLGAYLYEALGQGIPVIGVAKNPYKGSLTHVAKLYRGKSQNPLYLTSIGIPLPEAQVAIASMKGAYRMPDLLRQVDQLTKA